MLSFDGIDVIDENHLINLVSLTQIGRKVALVVLRDGQKCRSRSISRTGRKWATSPEAPQPAGNGLAGQAAGPDAARLSGIGGQLGFTDTTRGLLVLSIDPRSSLTGSVDVYDVLEEVARTPVATVADARSVLPKRGPRRSPVALCSQKRRHRRSHIVVWRRETRKARTAH